MKSLRPSLYVHLLSDSTIADLALLRSASESEDGRYLRLPTLRELLNEPRISKRLREYVERGIQSVVGWKILFSSDKAFREFCLKKLTEPAIPFNIHGLLLEVYLPRRLPAELRSIVQSWATAMIEAFAFRNFQHYRDCTAAVIQFAFDCPEGFLSSGCVHLTDFDFLEQSSWKQFSGRPNQGQNRHGQRSLGGVTWMDVYREYVNDASPTNDALNKSAARGRAYIQNGSKMCFESVWWPGFRPGWPQGRIAGSASIIETALAGDDFPVGWHFIWHFSSRNGHEFWRPRSAPLTQDYFEPMKFFDFR